MRRVVVIASASGSGKTTFARELARRLDVPMVELDALVHGPSWVDRPTEELRALVREVVTAEGWVIDGGYFPLVGDLTLPSADAVVWLDLPLRVWLPRLLRRTLRRIRTREELWHGNRESLRTAFAGRESLVVWALRTHFRRRREWPGELAAHQVVRLRTAREVERFLCASRHDPRMDPATR